MRRFVLLLVALFVAVVPALYAGSYDLNNRVMHLQGDTGKGDTFWLESQVKLNFRHLKIKWNSRGQMTRLRYNIECQDGQVVLQNVKYVDSALGYGESVRWQQSAENLNQDFSYIKDNRNRKRPSSVKHSAPLDIQPACLDSAKVEFHFHARDRHYIVTWEPKSGKMHSTWNVIR